VRREQRRTDERFKAESTFRKAIENSVPSELLLWTWKAARPTSTCVLRHGGLDRSRVGWCQAAFRLLASGAYRRDYRRHDECHPRRCPASGVELRFRRRSEN